jgi:hypothetical protein
MTGLPRLGRMKTWGYKNKILELAVGKGLREGTTKEVERC